MKKISLLMVVAAILLSNAVAFAQRNNDFRYDMAGFAFEIRKVNRLAEKANYFKNPEHYYHFGVAYLNFYSRLIEPLQTDQSADELKTDLYEQKSSEQVELNGKKYIKNVFEYDTKDHYCLNLYYTLDDKLQYWELESEFPYALDTAAWAFVSAKEAGIRDGDIVNKLRSFTDRTRMYLELKAYACHRVGKEAEAYQHMRKAIYVMGATGADSAYVGSQLFNSGFFAYQAGMYDECEKTLLEAIDYKFKEPAGSEGGIYSMLADCCRQRNDKDGAFKYSLMGLEAYPTMIDLIYEVINGYVAADDFDNALKYINKALEQDQENIPVLLLKASITEDADRKDEALAIYENVVRLDPGQYKAWNHMAVIRYQRGKAMLQAAMDEDDNKVYRTKLKEACLALYESVESFEKCVELQPDTPGNKETLRSVYATIRTELKAEHPELETKFQKLNAELGDSDK